MEWLNYHHLYYFWVIAHQGSIAGACQVLRLAQPTLSAQLKALEDRLGQPLFERRQRRLELTPTGRTVLSYADRIFRLGQEMMDTVADRPGGGVIRLQIGLVDAVPKPLAFALMRSVYDQEPLAQITIHEGRLAGLLEELEQHDLDLVLSNVAAANDPGRPLRSRLLGQLLVGLVAAPAWRHLRRDFPSSLRDAPMAIPTGHSPLHQELTRWLEDQTVTPRIMAECQDAELLKLFALEGLGLVPVNLQAVASELASGALVQIGPELTREQLWLVVAERHQLNPLAQRLWEGTDLWWQRPGDWG